MCIKKPCQVPIIIKARKANCIILKESQKCNLMFCLLHFHRNSVPNFRFSISIKCNRAPLPVSK